MDRKLQARDVLKPEVIGELLFAPGMKSEGTAHAASFLGRRRSILDHTESRASADGPVGEAAGDQLDWLDLASDMPEANASAEE